MRVYVATKWENREAASAFMQRLRERGHVITEDWTTHHDEEKAAPRDLEGVRSADVVVFLADKDLRYNGALVEMGIAHALTIPVVVVGDYYTSIFRHLPSVMKVNSADAALAEIEHATDSLVLRGFRQFDRQPPYLAVIR